MLHNFEDLATNSSRYGSIRACCASTTELTDFNPEGIIWGDRELNIHFMIQSRDMLTKYI